MKNFDPVGNVLVGAKAPRPKPRAFHALWRVVNSDYLMQPREQQTSSHTAKGRVARAPTVG
jgi:hypothetical protein